jgi:4'-phosphopantetheinyl transferase
VWQVGLDLPPDLATRLAGTLSCAERERLDRCPDRRLRRCFLAVRGAVRAILGDYLGTAPELVPLRLGRCGKPEVAGQPLQFNVSHSGRVVLLAVSGCRAVGVDVEYDRYRGHAARIAARFLRPEESATVAARGSSAYLRLWVRKEACVKAAGGRLAEGLSLPVSGAVVRDPTGRLPGCFALRDLPAPPGYAAALAVAGSQPVDVVPRWWRPSEVLRRAW